MKRPTSSRPTPCGKPPQSCRCDTSREKKAPRLTECGRKLDQCQCDARKRRKKQRAAKRFRYAVAAFLLAATAAVGCLGGDASTGAIDSEDTRRSLRSGTNFCEKVKASFHGSKTVSELVALLDLQRNDQYEELLACAKQAHPSWFWQLCVELDKVGSTELARQACDRAIEAGDGARSWNSLSIVLSNGGFLEEATASQLLAVELEPTEDTYRISLGFLYQARGHLESLSARAALGESTLVKVRNACTKLKACKQAFEHHDKQSLRGVGDISQHLRSAAAYYWRAAEIFREHQDSDQRGQLKNERIWAESFAGAIDDMLLAESFPGNVDATQIFF